MTGNSIDRHRQSGAALLLLMLVVIVGSVAILVTDLNRNPDRQHRLSATQTALAEAKRALLDFAATYPDTHPGSALQLPCPDLDASGPTLDGQSHTASCGTQGVSVLGRLPWRTLGIEPLMDGAGECLWYAISGEYKSAAAATATMINPDSNGQIQLFQRESAALIEGQSADERPVAVIIAPGAVVGTQTRQAVSQPGQQCSSDFSRSAFLETDAGSGVSNAVLTDAIAIEQFVRTAGESVDLNDRILTISRREIAELVYQRHDFYTRMHTLTDGLARCVAAYGLSNPGGPTDRRLPWPAAVALTDYRLDAQYDDLAGSVLSGRLADVSGDSNVLTGNAINRVVADCSAAAVPGWGPEWVALWQQWKDHFFYYVAESFNPAAAVPSNCVNCITVNSAGQMAGVVLFANRRLPAMSQHRNAPPLDTDTRDDIGNYLESLNASNHPYTGGGINLASLSANDSFNDILYCIDSTLSVTAC